MIVIRSSYSRFSFHSTVLSLYLFEVLLFSIMFKEKVKLIFCLYHALTYNDPTLISFNLVCPNSLIWYQIELSRQLVENIIHKVWISKDGSWMKSHVEDTWSCFDNDKWMSCANDIVSWNVYRSQPPKEDSYYHINYIENSNARYLFYEAFIMLISA